MEAERQMYTTFCLVITTSRQFYEGILHYFLSIVKTE